MFLAEVLSEVIETGDAAASTFPTPKVATNIATTAKAITVLRESVLENLILSIFLLHEFNSELYPY